MSNFTQAMHMIGELRELKNMSRDFQVISYSQLEGWLFRHDVDWYISIESKYRMTLYIDNEEVLDIYYERADECDMRYNKGGKYYDEKRATELLDEDNEDDFNMYITGINSYWDILDALEFDNRTIDYLNWCGCEETEDYSYAAYELSDIKILEQTLTDKEKLFFCDIYELLNGYAENDLVLNNGIDILERHFDGYDIDYDDDYVSMLITKDGMKILEIIHTELEDKTCKIHGASINRAINVKDYEQEEVEE